MTRKSRDAPDPDHLPPGVVLSPRLGTPHHAREVMLLPVPEAPAMVERPAVRVRREELALEASRRLQSELRAERHAAGDHAFCEQATSGLKLCGGEQTDA